MFVLKTSARTPSFGLKLVESYICLLSCYSTCERGITDEIVSSLHVYLYLYYSKILC